MKTNLLLTAAIFFAGTLISAQADDKEDLTNAIKKLAEKGNYSWTSTTKRPESTGGDTGGRGRRGASGPTEGKTADGLAYVSSKRGDRTSESLIKGKKSAYKGQDGWAAVEERSGREGGQRGRGRGRGGWGLRNFKVPAVQAEELLGNVSEIKKDGDAYSGSLKDEAAKALVSFGGGRDRGGNGGGERPQPTGVKATAKFWIKDGVLTKYETVAAGSISFNGSDRDLGRTTTVEIKEVGTTKIDVPEEAKKLVAE